MSTSIVLLALAAGWCAYSVVWWRDSRRSSAGRSDRIDSFSTGMGTLGVSASRSMTLKARQVDLMPRSAGAAARRRQEIVLGLAAAAAVTLVAALVFGVVALLVHVVVDLVLLGYSYAMVQRRNLAAEREMKVQMLYPEGVTPLRSAERRTVSA